MPNSSTPIVVIHIQFYDKTTESTTTHLLQDNSESRKRLTVREKIDALLLKNKIRLDYENYSINEYVNWDNRSLGQQLDEVYVDEHPAWLIQIRPTHAYRAQYNIPEAPRIPAKLLLWDLDGTVIPQTPLANPNQEERSRRSTFIQACNRAKETEIYPYSRKHYPGQWDVREIIDEINPLLFKGRLNKVQQVIQKISRAYPDEIIIHAFQTNAQQADGILGITARALQHNGFIFLNYASAGVVSTDGSGKGRRCQSVLLSLRHDFEVSDRAARVAVDDDRDNFPDLKDYTDNVLDPNDDDFCAQLLKALDNKNLLKDEVEEVKLNETEKEKIEAPQQAQDKAPENPILITRKRLETYIKRIENYNIDDDESMKQDLRFTLFGQPLFADMQVKNRRANYYFAKELIKLLDEENPDIQDIFNDSNLQTLRQRVIANYNLNLPWYSISGIRSLELNRIIDDVKSSQAAGVVCQPT